MLHHMSGVMFSPVLLSQLSLPGTFTVFWKMGPEVTLYSRKYVSSHVTGQKRGSHLLRWMRMA